MVAAVTWKGRGPPGKKGEGSSPAQQGSGQNASERQRGGRQRKDKKASNSGSSSSKWMCFRHTTFGSRAFSCGDEERCTFSGN